MRRLRIALSQINVTVGDLEGNKRKILHYLDQARGLGVDLIAFPELAITGYPPEDLLLKPAFIEANVKCLHEIVAETRGLTYGRRLCGDQGRAQDPGVRPGALP